MIKPYLFIPHTADLNSTRRAYNSVKDCDRVNVTVIDNSGARAGSDITWDECVPDIPSKQVVQAPVRLNMSQIHNFCAWYALNYPINDIQDDLKSTFFIRMHNDAENVEDSLNRLLDITYKCIIQGRKWGVILTHYDTISAWNLECPEIYWDEIRYGMYSQDIDCWLRMEHSGWEIIDTDLKVIHHNGSITVRTNNDIRRVAAHMGSLEKQFLQERWGDEREKRTPTLWWNFKHNRPHGGPFEKPPAGEGPY